MLSSEPQVQVIDSSQSFLAFNFRALGRYRYLLFLLVRRNFQIIYGTTFLGPLWVFLSPLLTTVTLVVVFQRVARLSTDGIPALLFYWSGLVVWNCFSQTLTTTSTSVLEHRAMIGKVYFPRIILPLSAALTKSVELLVQVLLFLLCYGAFAVISPGSWFSLSPYVLLAFPLLLFLSAAFGFGLGLCLSVVMIRFRDLHFVMSFFLQLGMLVSPVVYPTSMVDDPWTIILWFNPIASLISFFRSLWFVNQPLPIYYLILSGTMIGATLLVGFLVFNVGQRAIADEI